MLDGRVSGVHLSRLLRLVSNLAPKQFLKMALVQGWIQSYIVKVRAGEKVLGLPAGLHESLFLISIPKIGSSG